MILKLLSLVDKLKQSKRHPFFATEETINRRDAEITEGKGGTCCPQHVMTCIKKETCQRTAFAV